MLLFLQLVSDKVSATSAGSAFSKVWKSATCEIEECSLGLVQGGQTDVVGSVF